MIWHKSLSLPAKELIMSLYSNSITPKLPKVETSVFAVMSQMAADYHAVNLSQGFPDFDISEELIGLVHKHMQEGRNQYAPMKGVKRLREAIRQRYRSAYHAEYDADEEVTITAGATQAIYTAISAFVREDDEVIIFQPAYDLYAPTIRMNGGTVKYCNMTLPDYRINWQEVSRMVNSKTRMIIINTPHNPTGSVLSSDDMHRLESIVKGRDIIILSDEVYEHLIYDGHRHLSAAMYPEIASRSFVVGSFGKTLHATGWKVGYALAPAFLMKEFRKLHQFVVFAVNTPVQHAIADYLEHYDLSKLAPFYQNKRDYFLEKISESRFKPIPAKGTYFQVLDYSAISDMPETAFAEHLIKNHGIAAIPMSPFYKEKINRQQLRFCFAKKEATINKAAEILCRI